jgi:hypothetical protein
MRVLPADYDLLTPRERREVREQYIELQGGDCHYCKAGLDGEPAAEVLAKELNMRLFPKGFLDHPVHLHHSHDTGYTIGAVHAYCNGVLWQYEGE